MPTAKETLFLVVVTLPFRGETGKISSQIPEMAEVIFSSDLLPGPREQTAHAAICNFSKNLFELLRKPASFTQAENKRAIPKKKS